MAAGRRRQALRELGQDVTAERRTFLLLPGEGERPVYDDYVIRHRIAARSNAPELDFTIPRAGQPYPRSSLPPAVLALHARDHFPDRLDALEEELYRSVFTRLEDVADPSVLERAAASAGLPAGEVARALADASLEERALREHEEALSLGIGGIPAVLVPGQRAVMGAVPIDHYRAALARALGRPFDAPPSRGRRIG